MLRKLRKLSAPSSGRRRASGSTLLEALVAGAVMMIALMGGLAGITTAVKQNAFANRMTKASTLAAQTKETLVALGRDQIVGTILAAGNCTSPSSSSSLSEIVSKMDSAVVGAADGCLVDLDSSSLATYFPGYSQQDAQIFRRLLVVIDRNADVDTLAVVVSWNENGSPRFHEELFALYNPAGNNALAGL